MPQYQGVWTLEQQAQAQSNQQWVTDPNFKNTTLLLQADGTGSGSQNQTFLDGSTNNFFITRNGNTTQGSFSPFSPVWSNYFDGSGDYISMPSATSALALGSGDWTVECFAYITDFSDNRTLIDIYDGNSSVRFIWRIKTTGLLAFQGSNGTDRTVTTTTVPTNAWVHLAICKASGTTRMFINGIQSNTNYTDTNTYTNSGASAIGIISSDFSSSPYLGYISNFRVVKGTALYAANFNPPTATLTAVTNTSLLTCQSNRFVDNSTSALALTIGGNVSVQAFGPFAPALQWTPDVVGGSGYFDGTDYLTTPTSANLAMGSGDITAECWFYPKTSGNQQWMFDFRTSGSEGTTTLYAYISDSNSILYIGFGGFGDQAAGTPIKNAWNHVAVVRSGSGSNNVAAFLNGARTLQLTDTTNLSTSTAVYIGRRYAITSSQYMDGYICGSRFVKGTAVYSPSSSTLTLPTIPPTAVANTQLLLNYTNAGIYDGRMANNLETVGNAQVATSPVKYGSGSMAFDGTGDWLYNPVSTPNVAFGTGNFTVEMWVYPTSNPTNGPGTVMDARNGASSEGWVIRLFNDLSVGFYDGPANTYQQTAAGTISLNVWTHIACVRAGTVLTIYINGVALKTATLSNSLGTSWPFYIGNNYSAGYTYYGYIDDLRITKGVARYYANFTPPQQALPRQ